MKKQRTEKIEGQTPDGLWFEVTRHYEENERAAAVEVEEPTIRFRSKNGRLVDGYSVEEIERFAQLVSTFRKKDHMFDSVCGEHGYYSEAECPKCIVQPQLQLVPKKQSKVDDLIDPSKSTGGDPYGEF